MSNQVPWIDQWNAIETMRKEGNMELDGKVFQAPVDSLGAAALAYSHNIDAIHDSPAARESFRFRTLIATMLSPQTKDAQTALAFNNLLNLCRPSPSRSTGSGSGENSFIAKNLMEHSLEDITIACMPVSFHNTKAANILEACRKIVSKNYLVRNEETGDLEVAGIPTDVDDLLSFKGVGPKIAYLTFSIAWQRNEGICVDTHVHRIANRLRWVRKDDKDGKRKTPQGHREKYKALERSAEIDDPAQLHSSQDTKSPEKTRVALQHLLPRHLWGQVNELLVGFGQTICSAKRPLCHVCTLKDDCSWYHSTRNRNASEERA
jgi:endonuclease III